MLRGNQPDIEALLRPLSLASWREHEQRCEPFVVAADERRRDELQSIPELDPGSALAQGLRARLLRVEGETFRGEDEAPAPMSALAEGETLHCARLAELYPPLCAWEAASERRLGVPPGAVVIKQSLSGPRAGFPWHYDPADVVVAQVRGRKRWWLGVDDNAWQPPEGASVVKTPPRVLALVGAYAPPTRWRELVLEPGDVLFLPRGVHHRTEALEPSQSLSIRLRPPAWIEVLEVVGDDACERLLPRPEWRRRSYGAWRFLWGDEPSESLAELDALLERDLPGAHGGARALLERWWAEFEIAERGTPTRRAG